MTPSSCVAKQSVTVTPIHLRPTFDPSFRAGLRTIAGFGQWIIGQYWIEGIVQEGIGNLSDALSYAEPPAPAERTASTSSSAFSFSYSSSSFSFSCSFSHPASRSTSALALHSAKAARGRQRRHSNPRPPPPPPPRRAPRHPAAMSHRKFERAPPGAPRLGACLWPVAAV